MAFLVIERMQDGAHAGIVFGIVPYNAKTPDAIYIYIVKREVSKRKSFVPDVAIRAFVG